MTIKSTPRLRRRSIYGIDESIPAAQHPRHHWADVNYHRWRPTTVGPPHHSGLASLNVASKPSLNRNPYGQKTMRLPVNLSQPSASAHAADFTRRSADAVGVAGNRITSPALRSFVENGDVRKAHTGGPRPKTFLKTLLFTEHDAYHWLRSSGGKKTRAPDTQGWTSPFDRSRFAIVQF